MHVTGLKIDIKNAEITLSYPSHSLQEESLSTNKKLHQLA